MIDIIIPVFNEEEILKEREEYYRSLKTAGRITFVDGGSEDQTVQMAGCYGRVVKSSRGRAVQKNEGARAAESAFLLFLHVDCQIEPESLRKIEELLLSSVVGGCLTMTIEGRNVLFRLFELLVNLRAKVFKMLDGDLGQFVRKDVFFSLGGYDQVSIMEDILFSEKLRKAGKVAVMDERIISSDREWVQEGYAATFKKYALAYIKMWTQREKL